MKKRCVVRNSDGDATMDDLSESEHLDYYRRRKMKACDKCADGMCGGCRACLDAQGICEDEIDLRYRQHWSVKRFGRQMITIYLWKDKP